MQTASQMMAAKRAAKKESAVKKYARENIGNKRADRNKLANIATIHAMNKMAMHKGEPQSLDAQLTENIKNLMHYEAMVYGYDRISVTVFEKLIRAMRVVACIYADSELNKTTTEAQAAIESLRSKDSDDLSPLCKRANRTVHRQPVRPPETLYPSPVRHHRRQIDTSHRKRHRRKRKRVA